MKIKCIDDSRENITKGKIYETDGIDPCGQYKITDDYGDEIFMNEKHFEEIFLE